MNPDFALVGAMKAGTSSLAEWFAKNAYAAPPEMISGAPIKETTYFGVNYHLNRPGNYEHLFRNKKPKQISYEASADYFHTDEVPERIFKHNPETKIIILLRDPVERIWSHYFHEVNYNRVENEPFMEAIKKPIKNDFDNYHFAYLKIGEYLEHLKKWYTVFPAEQIAVVFSHDLWNNSHEVFQHLQLYVGLPIIISMSEYKAYNVGKKEKMSNEIREFLIDYYNPYNEELAEKLKIKNPWRYEFETVESN